MALVEPRYLAGVLRLKLLSRCTLVLIAQLIRRLGGKGDSITTSRKV